MRNACQIAIRLATTPPPSITANVAAVSEAELWDSPNLLVSSILMLTAAVTGAKPKLGDHAKVAI